TGGASVGLSVAETLPTALVRGVTDVARAVVGTDTMPRYTGDLPGGGVRRSRALTATARPASTAAALSSISAIFLPSCQGTMFAPGDPRGLATMSAVERLCRAAGVELIIPDGIDGLCCSTPWSSKG